MSSTSASVIGVAGRYASALFDLARERDALDAVARDLETVAAMLEESAELGRALRSPVVKTDVKTGIVRALGEKAGFHDLTGRFLGVLGEQERLDLLADMVVAFATLLAERRGEATVEVVSAVPLAPEQEEAVREMARASLGKTIQLKTAVDPDLLGGLVLRVGSRMIDASVKTKLRHLELAMRGAG
ncbi:MAG: F0F1 ATP synthase subunit delta [Alphaproteobacteria bacterium]